MLVLANQAKLYLMCCRKTLIVQREPDHEP